MAESTETGLPRAVAIAWGMQEVPQRGPSRGLSHERIVAAAVEIADADGLPAVTMQAVAKSLGFTTMSLYRYVSSKDELLRLMQDAALTVPETVRLDEDWRTALHQWAGLIRDAYRAHPWALSIPRDQTSVLMPNTMRTVDVALAAMRDLALDDAEKLGTIMVISQHAAGMVELELSLNDAGTLAITAEGAEMLGEVVTAERHPHLRALMARGHYVPLGGPSRDADGGADDAGADGAVPPPAEDVDEEYTFGLDLLLDGLAARAEDR
ncbi:TetR/AcrR family transcriptional regulator [Nesterenkonia halobia]|uniref:TetR/AcrR family transcriptional regulator n=1 Tax=Nesterenkonia halobia TaxID=37922 RepID=A0ABP6RLD2_9MICC